MNKEIKEFIEDNKDLIEENEWDELYEKLDTIKPFQLSLIGEFTEILLQAHIDPLEYMKEVPAFYLDRRTVPYESYSLPSSIKGIKVFAFAFTEGLKKINTNKVTKIGQNAFNSSDLEIINIESKCSIQPSAFENCLNLTTVFLPEIFNVKSEDGRDLIFSGCVNLKEIIYNGTEDDFFYFSTEELDRYKNKGIIKFKK